ncbi:MAG TPA: serine hydrolase domain-containing protein, partial [Gemmatimonadaceae bacterium]
MKRTLCILAIVAPAIARAQDSVAANERYAGVAGTLSAFVAHERREKGIPAISVALVDGRRIVWARGFGWADSAAGVPASASTVYRVGSVSKLFTDIGIMRLVEQGKLSLDAPVQRYVPELKPKNPFGADFTLRQLTSHRSGLTREPPVGNYFDDHNPSLAATVASLNSTSLVFKPGTRAKYSNAGIAVLGYVLERTQRESFYPYLKGAVLDPMGLSNSAFQPLPTIQSKLAKATMWTIDGRTSDAPTFQLGMGPCGSMYSTVLDLGRFLEILFARGVTPEGNRVLAAATLDTMWTPQFAAAGARTGYGIGFNIGQLNGRRTIGHGGAIYGFATTLLGLPDDSLGVVVTATLDGVNAVTDHIARAAVELMLAAREGRAIAAVDTTRPIDPSIARAMRGRSANARTAVDLDEFEGQLFLTPVRGGSRGELRVAEDGDWIVDDRLAYGQRVRPLSDGRIVLGADTLVNRKPPAGQESRSVASLMMTATGTIAPPAAPHELASLIGEYGWDHNVLYIREKDGKLNALIEWFFEYPLERVSRDVYRFPNFGLYDSQEIVFRRDANGRATVAVAGTVPFPRRALPGDDDRVSFRIT